MKEFLSFYKTAGGNEGEKCHYSTRLDTYGCGCTHNCKYCYAKSLLSFRGLWDAQNPAVADIEKIRKTIKQIPAGTVIRLGGMTDCFQPCEEKYGVTYETIKALNEAQIEYLIVTKSALIAQERYLKVLDKRLAHIQVTVTTLEDKVALAYENASPPSERIKAILKLQEEGYDVAIRLSPYIPSLMDEKRLSGLGIDKAIVEFLRVNSWVRKWFKIDYSQYSKYQNGYHHLPLARKLQYIENLKGFKEISVCEDCDDDFL